MKKKIISSIIASLCIALMACIPLLVPKTSNLETASANYIPNSPIGYYKNTTDSDNHQAVDIFLSSIVSGSNYSKQVCLWGGDGSDGTHFDIGQVFHIYKDGGVTITESSVGSDGISYHASPCTSGTATNMQVSSVVKMTNNIILALYNGYISASASADYSSLNGQYASLGKKYDKVDNVAMYFFAFNKDDVSKSAGQKNTESKQINGFTGTNTVLSYSSTELSNVGANVFEMVFTCFYEKVDWSTSTNYIQIKDPSFTFTTTDTTAPTMAFEKVNTEQYVYTRNLTLSSSDADSGVQRIEVSYNGGEYETIRDYTADLTFASAADYEAKKDVTENYTIEQNGTYKFRTIDNVGNVSSEVEYIEEGIDRDAPTIDITGLDSVVFSALRDFTFHAALTDTTISPNHFSYKVTLNGDEQASGEIIDSKDYSFSVAENGVYTLTISGVDEVGNTMEDKVYTLIVTNFDLKDLYKTTYLDFNADTESNGLLLYTFRVDMEYDYGVTQSYNIQNGLNQITLDKLSKYSVTCKFYATQGETSYFGWSTTVQVDNEFCDLITSAVNGTIDESSLVKRGEHTVHFQANEGYSLYTLKLNGEIQSGVDANATSFTFIVDNPVTIEVVFRKNVELAITDSYIYNGGILALQYSLTEELVPDLQSQFSNDLITFTYFEPSGSQIDNPILYTFNVGVYRVSYKIDNELFVGSGEVQITINSKPVEITGIVEVYKYTGSALSFVYDRVDEVIGVYVKFSQNGEDAEFKNAGEYTYTVLTDNANYLVLVEGKAVILPNIKDITNLSAIYNGTEQHIEFNFEGAEDHVYAEYYQNDIQATPLNAGTYSVKFFYAPSTTAYELSADQSYTFEIIRADVVVTATSLEKVYDGIAPEVSVTVVGFVAGYNYDFELVHSVTKNVGDYSVIITRAEEPEFSNYNITYVDGRVKITPKTVYVKSKDGLSKEYGDPDPDFNNTELIAEYIRGVVDDDELGLTFYRDASEAVGTYEIKAKITNTNYTLDFTRSQFIINKRLAIIVVNDSSKIYGEEDEQFDFVRTSMVLPEDVELVLNSIKRDVGEDAGEYKLYLDTSALENYTVITMDAKFTIYKRQIKVVANGVTGENAVIFGESAPLTYTVYDATTNGLMSGVVLSGSLEREPGEDVGVYKITLGTLDGGKNYEISAFEDAEYQVVPKQLKVVANAASKVYGDAESLTYQIYGIASSEVLEGVVLVGSLSREPGEDVGVYKITLGTLNGGKNYEISAFEENYLEITKAELHVFVENMHKAYGAADEPLVPTVTGAKNGDELVVVLIRAEGEELGSYLISIDADASSDIYKNYNVTMQEAYYIIGQATLSASLADKTTTYSGEAQTIDPLSLSEISPEEITYVYSYYGETMDTLPVDAGTYLVKAIFAGNEHYEAFETEEVTLVINKKQVPITIKNLKFIYDGTPKTPEYVAGTDNSLKSFVQLAFTSGVDNAIEVGTYQFTITANNPNYTCNVTMTLTILPAFEKEGTDSSVSADSVNFSNSTLEFVEVKDSGLKSTFSSSTDGRRCVSVYEFRNTQGYTNSNDILKVSIKAKVGQKNVEIYLVGKDGTVTPVAYEIIDGYYVLQVNDVTASVLVTVADRTASYVQILLFVLVLLLTYYVSKNIRKQNRKKFFKRNTTVSGITEKDYIANEQIVESIMVDENEYEDKKLI